MSWDFTNTRVQVLPVIENVAEERAWEAEMAAKEYATAGNFADAARKMTEASEHAPSVERFSNLSKCLMHLDRVPEALAAAEKAVDFHPNSALGYERKGRALNAMSQNQANADRDLHAFQAVEAFAKAMRTRRPSEKCSEAQKAMRSMMGDAYRRAEVTEGWQAMDEVARSTKTMEVLHAMYAELAEEEQQGPLVPGRQPSAPCPPTPVDAISDAGSRVGELEDLHSPDVRVPQQQAAGGASPGLAQLIPSARIDWPALVCSGATFSDFPDVIALLNSVGKGDLADAFAAEEIDLQLMKETYERELSTGLDELLKATVPTAGGRRRVINALVSR